MGSLFSSPINLTTMRRRRKQNACLNCGYPLDSDIYNYCPSCGQENTSTNISFGRLVIDFFNNAFSFDSRLSNSVVPFFFKPGYLTLRFNEGKRASYVNPVRLYLIISLFYFFTINLVGKKITRDIEEGISEQEATSPGFSIGPALLSGKDSLHIMDSLNSELAELQKDGPLFTAEDSVELGFTKQGIKDPIRITTNGDSLGSFFGISSKNWATYNRLKDDRKITDQMLYDSLNLENNSATEKFVARQIIRVNRADRQTVVEFVTKNLPILMFVMLPFFALLLKLLYIRRNVLYVQHIVHAIHLHCFAYIVYGLALIFLLAVDLEGSGSTWVVTISITLVTTYAYTSFLRVYQQGWFKTVTKFLLLGWVYSWGLFMGVIAELIISFLIF